MGFIFFSCGAAEQRSSGAAEQDLLSTLQDKFNLKCSIHYNRDNKPRIYIFKESMDNLITLVKPYFINEMLYKLGL